ncbi:hypothetical protein [Methanohalobium sp.]|uniref:hypothetical protein n=1 Tax=Methanohalobium sp. TaxID=2837493 RepID=UPI002600FE34|nr:hypothetical protein [Methanohalobium sp.]
MGSETLSIWNGFHKKPTVVSDIWGKYAGVLDSYGFRFNNNCQKRKNVMSLNKDRCYSEKNTLDKTKNKEELNQLFMDKFEDTGYKSDCIEDEKSACEHVPESIGYKSKLYINNKNLTNKKICDFETELNLNIS